MGDSKKNNRPIGVFDSGVGGLSVLKELKHLLPHENFVFLADQLYVPYGEKSKKELVKLVYKIADYLKNQHKVKMMVVACNTATCNAIEELRKKYPFPIVGTVPAIKLAAKKTRTGTIAVISTPSTSRSKALKDLVKDNCQNLSVLNIGCKDLEDEVEKGELHSSKVNSLLLKYLKEVKGSKVDCLVLGCTHYPFLKEFIKKIIGPGVELIDGNKGIAKRTRSLLMANFLKNNQKRAGKVLYLTTGNSLRFSDVATKLLKSRVKAEKVKI